jgi:hypothetical protein
MIDDYARLASDAVDCRDEIVKRMSDLRAEYDALNIELARLDARFADKPFVYIAPSERHRDECPCCEGLRMKRIVDALAMIAKQKEK